MGADCTWRDAAAAAAARAKCLTYSGLDFWFLAPRAYAAAPAGTLGRALRCEYAPSRQRGERTRHNGGAASGVVRHHPETAIHVLHYEHSGPAGRRTLDAAFRESREGAAAARGDGADNVAPRRGKLLPQTPLSDPSSSTGTSGSD